MTLRADKLLGTSLAHVMRVLFRGSTSVKYLVNVLGMNMF
ncbi:hypothetical protein E3G42_003171 [Mycobacteroides abscessus]|nr:hypothetical protein [Mycobacteroides abscessus]QOF24890.1 hypothetical protein E3G42_003171 [Mycobacteroides abscessus]SLH93138.1 Uncharacterised protein [Mycobacteroides abscessus subsp. massiliense]SLI29952.1 Uncharacterised protein [Mycobacteroides abscessus subsp. massiliense]